MNTNSTNWTTWKTIDVGDFANIDTVISKLGTSGILVTRWAMGLLKKIQIHRTPKKISLARLSVSELGFANGGTTTEIFAKAQKLGLFLCHSEVPVQLRLQYTDQQVGDHVFIAMKPLKDNNGTPSIFFIEKIQSKLWLYACSCDANFMWDAKNKFVFQLSR